MRSSAAAALLTSALGAIWITSGCDFGAGEFTFERVGDGAGGSAFGGDGPGSGGGDGGDGPGSGGAASCGKDCVLLSDCEPGQYVDGVDPSSELRRCRACDEGTFSAAANADECAPWSLCPAGSLAPIEASAQQDRECSSGLGWANSLGTPLTDYGNGVAVGSDYVYVVGNVSGTLPGETSAGGSDIFIALYEKSGDFVGAHQFGTTGQDQAYSVAVVPDEGIYVLAHTTGTWSGASSSGVQDVVLLFFEHAGTDPFPSSPSWIRQFGSTAADYANMLVVDDNDDVYVVGRTFGAFGGASLGGSDSFVAKYAKNSSLLWSLQFGTAGDERAHAVALGADGSVFIAGSTTGSFDEDPADAGDAYLAKVNSSGVLTWTRQFGSSGIDWANGLAIDDDDDIYVTGYTADVLSGASSLGNDDAFLRKYDSAGEVVWTEQFGSSSADYGNAVLTSGGRVFVLGTTTGAVFPSRAAGSSDVFLREFDADGAAVSTIQFGTPSNDYGFVIARDDEGRVYVSGNTFGSFPGQTNAGDRDPFIAQLLP